MASQSEIVCPSCGTWNKIEGEPGNCMHCSAPLRPVSQSDKESIERRMADFDVRVPILATDSKLVRFGKHVFNAVQFVFLAIVSFFFWLIAASPG